MKLIEREKERHEEEKEKERSEVVAREEPARGETDVRAAPSTTGAI